MFYEAQIYNYFRLIMINIPYSISKIRYFRHFNVNLKNYTHRFKYTIVKQLR